MSSFKNESSFLFLLCSLDYLGLVKIHSLVRGWKYFPPGSQVLIFHHSAPLSAARGKVKVHPDLPGSAPRQHRAPHAGSVSALLPGAIHLKGNPGATNTLTCSCRVKTEDSPGSFVLLLFFFFLPVCFVWKGYLVTSDPRQTHPWSPSTLWHTCTSPTLLRIPQQAEVIAI